MTEQVAVETKVRKPKHIIYLEDRVREAKAYEEDIRKQTTGKDWPYSLYGTRLRKPSSGKTNWLLN